MNNIEFITSSDIIEYYKNRTPLRDSDKFKLGYEYLIEDIINQNQVLKTKSIEKIALNRIVPIDFHAFGKFGHSFSVTKNRAVILQERITTFTEKAKENTVKMRKYIGLSKNEFKLLDDKIENFKKDPLIKKVIADLKDKIRLFDESSKSFEEIRMNLQIYERTQLMKDRNNTLIVNTNIDSNAYFSPLVSIIDKFNELNLLGQTPIIDLDYCIQKMQEIHELSIDLFLKARSNGYKHNLNDAYHDEVITKRKSALTFLNTTGDLKHQPVNIKELDNLIYKRYMVFQDHSILFERIDGSFKQINTKKDFITVRNEILDEALGVIFKKYPTFKKEFFKIGTTIEAAAIRPFFTSIDTFKNNLTVLRLNNFDYFECYNNKKSDETLSHFLTAEKVDDEMNRIVQDHKVKKFAHSITSKKYEHLYDETTYLLMKELYDLNIEKSTLQKFIGVKIAAFHKPEEFNKTLSKFLSAYNGFEPHIIIEKATECGASIIHSTDDKIILEIDSFDKSKHLGSSSWCITREPHYFEGYVKNGEKQYFIYDFTKRYIDNSSMIGITLDKGNYSTAHYKNDEQISERSSHFLENLNIIKLANVSLEEKSVKKFKI
jgi:hypothetical protein